MDQVQQSREEIVIQTRQTSSKLVPVDEFEPRSVLGYLQGTVEIVGDIVSPLESEWEANCWCRNHFSC
jgi:hypothetical protein